MNGISRLFFKLIALLLLSTSMQNASAASNAIVIGHIIDLSGSNSSIGRDYVAGIKTFIDGLNAAGGLQGKKIQYIARDDQGQAALAARLATEMIEADQVDYLFGGVGEEMTQAILQTPAFKKSEHILYAPLAGAGNKKDPRVLIWRPSYQQELEYIFSHFNKTGIKNIGIVYQDSAPNKQALNSLVTEVRKVGMKVTGTMPIGDKNTQLKSDAALLANGNPEFVMVIADTFNTALFLKEFRQLRPNTFVAGTSLTDLTALKELLNPKALEWTVFSQVVPDPNAAHTGVQIEHLRMMKKFRDEAASSLTLEGYAAAKTLIRIIQQSKNTHSALQEYVSQQSEMDLGGMSISHSRNNNNLSRYLEIALFKKGGGLKY